MKVLKEWCTWKHDNWKEAPAWAVNWKEQRASRASCQLSHVHNTGMKATHTWLLRTARANPWEEQASGQSAEEKAAGLFTEDVQMPRTATWDQMKRSSFPGVWSLTRLLAMYTMACSNILYLWIGGMLISPNDTVFFLSVPFVWFLAIRMSVLSLQELSWNFQIPTIIPQFLPW